MSAERPLARRTPPPGALWPLRLEGSGGIVLDPHAPGEPVPIVTVALECAHADHPPTMADPAARTVDVWMPASFARRLVEVLERQIEASEAEAAEFRRSAN